MEMDKGPKTPGQEPVEDVGSAQEAECLDG